MVIHTLFTGYPQPEVVHKLSTELSTGYPQGRVVHRLSTPLRTGYPQSYPQVVLWLTVSAQRRNNVLPHCILVSLHEPYNPPFGRVIIGAGSGDVHPRLAFEYECIIAWIPYRILTTLRSVGVFLHGLTGTAECYTIQAYTLKRKQNGKSH